MVVVRFRGRGVWRFHKPTLMEVQKGMAKVGAYGNGARRQRRDCHLAAPASTRYR